MSDEPRPPDSNPAQKAAFEMLVERLSRASDRLFPHEAVLVVVVTKNAPQPDGSVQDMVAITRTINYQAAEAEMLADWLDAKKAAMEEGPRNVFVRSGPELDSTKAN